MKAGNDRSKLSAKHSLMHKIINGLESIPVEVILEENCGLNQKKIIKKEEQAYPSTSSTMTASTSAIKVFIVLCFGM